MEENIRDKFTEIVDRTKHTVLSAIGMYLYSNFSDAIDDVVQETYLRAYKSLVKGNFKQESDLKTWLYSIARNESLRMNKKLIKNKSENLEYVSEQYAYNIFLNKAEHLRLKEHIEKMSVKYKKLFQLILDGYKLNEIGEELSIPLGTVKSRVNRGKKQLCKLISEV